VRRPRVTDGPAEPVRHAACHETPRVKSAITWGAAPSNPTTSSMPGSVGSAIEKPVDVMPTTISRAGRPIACLYSLSAWNG